jgi:tetratricopeptide (TPR) repeat protein
MTGDAATAEKRAEEAIELYRVLDDARGTADALWRLGATLYSAHREASRAARVLRESITLFDELGDVSSLGAMRTLAALHMKDGELDRARPLYEEVVRRARSLGNELWEATALGALAMVALEEGRVADALPLLQENMPFYRGLADPLLVTENLCRVASALVAVRDPVPAVQLLGCSAALFEEVGASPPWVVQQNAETGELARAQLDERAFADAWEAGCRLAADDAVDLALESLERARTEFERNLPFT